MVVILLRCQAKEYKKNNMQFLFEEKQGTKLKKFEMANSTVDMMLDGLEGDEESSPFETSVIINSVLNALLIPICIAGNALVLAAVWRNPSLRTASNILLCSLAVTDFFVGFLLLPVNIAHFILSESSFYSGLPQARIVLTIQLCSVSLETMTAISVDRYLALRYHM